MLSLRCRINANVAELLVIIGYSELGPTLGARPFARSLARSLGRLPACLPARPSACSLPHPPHSPPVVHPGFASSPHSPVWSFPRLPRCLAARCPLPRCRGSHWRASRWTESAPTTSPRSLSIHTIRTAIRDQLERIFGCSRSIENAILYLPRNV